MQLRWSEEATDDLERITNYRFEETPQHAPELVRAVYHALHYCNFPIVGSRLFEHISPLLRRLRSLRGQALVAYPR